MKEYIDLSNRILEFGEVRKDRTGVGTVSLFGEKMVFDLLDGFTAVTTKLVYCKTAIKEGLWICSGSTSNLDLKAQKVSIWDEWALPNGELGPIYGKQLRDFNGVDQLAMLVEGLKNKPFSRRHIISYWNPEVLPFENLSPQDNVELGLQALPPCHAFAQWYVSNADNYDRVRYMHYLNIIERIRMTDEELFLSHNQENYDTDKMNQILDSYNIPKLKLSCQLYQRSADVVLGIPFNLVMYPMLTMMLAQQCGFIHGMYHHVIGDAHVYLNHVEAFKEQLSRDPYPRPILKINNLVESVFDYKTDDFELIDYQHHEPISYAVAT